METAETFLGARLAREFGSLEAAAGVVQPAEWAMFVRTLRGHPRPLPKGHLPDGPAASVHANHGRWLVACPFGCGEHQHASDTDRRFFCTTCRNAPVGGMTVPVVWPDAKQRRAVEGALARRPHVRHMNWWPHETAADLERENALHLGSA